MNRISRTFQRINYLLEKKAIVLSYHRVATPYIDPWEISVSPANFEEHLQVLKNYRIITPNQLLMYLKKGELRNNMVCITFDDGYQDNYIKAKPLLEKYDLNSTIFIPFQFIGQQKEFWWDELQSIIFCPHDLPEKLSIMIGEEIFEFHLEHDAKFDGIQDTQNKSWIWNEKPRTKRAELYLKLWELLRPLEYYSINEVLENLKRWISFEIHADESNFPMTNTQLETIISHPLFDIGIHTVTHPALVFRSKQEQFNEILKCKQNLDEMSGQSLNTIAYPYGLYNDDTIEVAKQIGLQLGFTTQGSAVKKGDHPLKLARYHVKNWDGNEFENRLRIWRRGF